MSEFRSYELGEWVRARISERMEHFRKVPGGQPTYQDAIRGWREEDWAAFRVCVEELGHTCELEARDPEEWKRRSVVVAKFMRDQPKRMRNGVEYECGWSWALQVAALKRDREKNPGNYPEYDDGVVIHELRPAGRARQLT